MNQQSFGQKFGRATEAGPGSTPGGGSAKGVQKPAGAKPGTTNQAVLGLFTLRDLAVFAATLILLVASLLPIFFGRFNLWNAGSLFFLGLGIVLPLIVTALFAARRLAPATKVRIGSLSVDQFGSVVASFALAFFFVSTAAAFVPSLLVGLVGSVVLFAGTVLSRFIPYFAGDFLGRDETPAHVMARDSAVPLPKPHTPKEPKPAATPVPEASAPVAPSSAAATSARAAAPAASAGAFSAPAAPAAAAAVSSAPEVSEWSAAGDPSPATQAADVVPSPSATGTSAVPAVAETSAGDVPTAAAAAPVPTATASAAAAPEAATHDAGTGVSAAPRQSAAEPAATAVHQQVRRVEPIGATVDPASRPEESYEEPEHEAFWFAVAQHRTAVDPQTGAPAFVIEPGGWVLALEDRGHEFLVQHTDGRVGVLRDLSNIERG
ncbi:hypothetical protein NIBR502772_20550 [Pseudarthrobacter sp. NIBRBAC000502772]|uniref:hypothetical protein n=1 Tax=Pseudarthrobacter sp. NIBRBAC000502772 TaxID=2590775 RepID=UPI0011326A24|nr:hypothetical protein [Pseudarthrobacter sp. NIBRBAC000502772]QDG68280.1 hypothetical protein NIBR502772_20550 [Pseudarthrobacter sp. NIBRBAC000502772]